MGNCRESKRSLRGKFVLDTLGVSSRQMIIPKIKPREAFAGPKRSKDIFRALFLKKMLTLPLFSRLSE